MADELTLAREAMNYLSPHFESLLKSGVAAVGKEIPGAVKALWGKIKDRLGKSAAGKEAVDDLTANPVSEINRDALKAALAKTMTKEPDFVQELTELLKQAGKVDGGVTISVNAGNNSTVKTNVVKGNAGDINM